MMAMNAEAGAALERHYKGVMAAATTPLAHSVLGASSMYRWSACPGSVARSANMPNTSSKYAEEGTAAHDFAAKVLSAWASGGDKTLEADAVEAFKTADQEMIDAVRVYTEIVQDHCVRGSTLLVEHRFDLSAVYAGCFGTCDAVVYNPHIRTLYVFDFKYGAGIPVEAKANPQLRYYGLGAVLTTDFKPRAVELVIVQPRCGHPDGPIRSEQIDALELLDFRADLIEFARATENPNAKLSAGDHCRFCPAAALCPELHAKATDAAKTEFSAVSFAKSGQIQPYDPIALRKALDSRDIIKAWLKALDEFAYAEAEAGRTPPGYKLVAKRATRKWRNETDVTEFLQDMGVVPAVMYEPRALKSPAQLEAVIDKKVLAPFVVAESSGHTLAPETDKRQAVSRTTAAQDFTVVQPT